jgi:hypothetical protein
MKIDGKSVGKTFRQGRYECVRADDLSPFSGKAVNSNAER